MPRVMHMRDGSSSSASTLGDDVRALMEFRAKTKNAFRSGGLKSPFSFSEKEAVEEIRKRIESFLDAHKNQLPAQVIEQMTRCRREPYTFLFKDVEHTLDDLRWPSNSKDLDTEYVKANLAEQVIPIYDEFESCYSSNSLRGASVLLGAAIESYLREAYTKKEGRSTVTRPLEIKCTNGHKIRKVNCPQCGEDISGSEEDVTLSRLLQWGNKMAASRILSDSDIEDITLLRNPVAHGARFESMDPFRNQIRRSNENFGKIISVVRAIGM